MPSPTREEQEAFLRQLMDGNLPVTDEPEERAGSGGRGRQVQKTPDEPSPSFSLVNEIDRIFQRKLAASSLAGIDAQIMARPDGVVHIRVGTAHYDAPDQVPDVDLRRLIELSIAEW